MRRLLLVALREFLEHLRTKTFWIGILSFPVILVLSVLVPNWLSKKVDVRRYAVLDLSESGWLSQEVRARAETPDIYKVLLALKAAHARGGAGLELLPEILRGELLRIGIEELEESDLREASEAAQALRGPEGVARLERAALSEEERARIEAIAKWQRSAELQKWAQSLSPEQARRFGVRDERSRYRLVELGELEIPVEDARAAEEALQIGRAHV